MHLTIPITSFALAFLTTTSIATQVNVYGDTFCGNAFNYAVYSSGWGCQSVQGANSLQIAEGGAQCNFYAGNNCLKHGGRGWVFGRYYDGHEQALEVCAREDGFREVGKEALSLVGIQGFDV
ncbi:hypothetical protein LTS15_001812 [Exophiala xenobiotica]|nr:hypothetical protein LTS15_001812 [Exophiala xenobiotica]